MTELRTDTSGRVKKAKVCCSMVILLILKTQLVDSLTWKDLLFLPTLIARHDVHGRLSLTSFALTGSDHSDHVARFRQIPPDCKSCRKAALWKCVKMQRFSLQRNVHRAHQGSESISLKTCKLMNYQWLEWVPYSLPLWCEYAMRTPHDYAAILFRRLYVVVHEYHAFQRCSNAEVISVEASRQIPACIFTICHHRPMGWSTREVPRTSRLSWWKAKLSTSLVFLRTGQLQT